MRLTIHRAAQQWVEADERRMASSGGARNSTRCRADEKNVTDWFKRLSAECHLDPTVVRALDRDGFVVISGPVPDGELETLAAAYDLVMSAADEPDKRVSRTSTRVHDLVNRCGAFDALFQYPPLLAASCHTIRQPFKLSNMLGRTLHAGAGPDEIHVDAAPDPSGWPMLGFVVVVDAFTAENGATRFWPGSQQRVAAGEAGQVVESELVAACGPAGAVVVYNGSVMHGHGPNHTDRPRRSIQGAYIRREATGFGLPGRTGPETIARVGPLAKYLIGV